MRTLTTGWMERQTRSDLRQRAEAEAIEYQEEPEAQPTLANGIEAH